MVDIFDLPSEVDPKQALIEKFSKWWNEDEIKDEILPEIVPKYIKDSVVGTLKNFPAEQSLKPNNFVEILYQFVGPNFLVHEEKYTRMKFLDLILKKKVQEDPSFENRFLGFITYSTTGDSGRCKVCNKSWDEETPVYKISGLQSQIMCKDEECLKKQRRAGIPKISSSNFFDFLEDFKGGFSYKKLCKNIIEEFGFPRTVDYKSSNVIPLLPDRIEPLATITPLYDYQFRIGQKIRDMLVDYSRETSRALVVLPTGSGKTRTVVETLIDWLGEGKPGMPNSKFIVWIVDKKELCKQAFDTFAEVFRSRGKRDTSLYIHPIWEDNPKNIQNILYKYSTSKDDAGEIGEENGIIIGSIQSLNKISQMENNGDLPELGKYTSIVIIDEAHHAIPSNTSYNDVLKALGFKFKTTKDEDIHPYQARLLGLTATPFRGESEQSGKTNDLLNRFGGKARILWPYISEGTDKKNISPHAHVDVQKTAFVGERVKIYGDRSYDPDGRIKNYFFEITKIPHAEELFEEDLTIFDKKTEEKNVVYQFTKPGRYLIKLEVQDYDGKWNDNLAVANVQILPKEEQVEESNLENMKKLYSQLIALGILSRPHHYIINNENYSRQLDEKEVEHYRQFHDISDKTIREIGNDSSRNHKILEKISKMILFENKRSILLFACSVSHAKFLAFALSAVYGIPAKSIDHTTGKEDRDKITQEFRAGTIYVLCNYDMLTTGFDAPRVDCVFVARPTFSHLLYNQMSGRGLRGPRNGGTEECLIVDISDNIQLQLSEDEAKETWKIFDYIYETTFDERKKGDQKCYVCHGDGFVRNNSSQSICKICNGKKVLRL